MVGSRWWVFGELGDSDWGARRLLDLYRGPG